MFFTRLAFKPAVAQQANNSWANNMQQPLTYSTTPVKSFSSLPIHKPNNLSHGQEKDDVMKSLIQQSSLHAALPNRKQMTDLPGWTISQNSANPNPAEPVIDMSNLPEGSYFGK